MQIEHLTMRQAGERWESSSGQASTQGGRLGRTGTTLCRWANAGGAGAGGRGGGGGHRERHAKTTSGDYREAAGRRPQRQQEAGEPRGCSAMVCWRRRDCGRAPSSTRKAAGVATRPLPAPARAPAEGPPERPSRSELLFKVLESRPRLWRMAAFAIKTRAAPLGRCWRCEWTRHPAGRGARPCRETRNSAGAARCVLGPGAHATGHSRRWRWGHLHAGWHHRCRRAALRLRQ